MIEALTAQWSVEWWGVALAGFSTLAIFSFLLGENPVFRLFEHLYIGISAAIGIMITVQTFFWPKLLKPLLGLDIIILADGTPSAPYQSAQLLYLFPMAFGSLYYFILSPRRAWLAQLVIGFSLGVAGGFAFKAVFNEFLPQLYDSFRPLYIPGAPGASVSNLIFIVTLLSSMTYFFLTIKQPPGGALSRVALSGRWLMMGCFGSFFGATIMARMALLVERLQFLVITWWGQMSALW